MHNLESREQDGQWHGMHHRRRRNATRARRRSTRRRLNPRAQSQLRGAARAAVYTPARLPTLDHAAVNDRAKRRGKPLNVRAVLATGALLFAAVGFSPTVVAQPPPWAFAVNPAGAPPPADDGSLHHVPGS